ncbi:hypothetical protein PFICI_09828 [Pestalotiopsis fici W106-1]|uniref:Zn(2)-C6 fungal-type domain-containing protein n=1 Tax=Pestalotiopsis fici (strain W106-1 / CGMCC3.15140) TaxID=1229662 RepID=W3WY10_PESFW|nr:uncharacterized protein PFICI_09828 [Pestalotiopsis fici W106-1]ETS77766.1 hypothetical protein PFICI_09828 [Pestalotiopsis fici W106-1]
MAAITPESDLADRQPRVVSRPSTAVSVPSKRGGPLSRDVIDNPRKAPKTSRACDACKLKKTRCTGTRPCDRCVQRNLHCIYEAAYSRGKAPEPLPRETPSVEPHTQDALESRMDLESHTGEVSGSITTRDSPEFEHAEIEGRYVDPTSALTFLHRAQRRFLHQANNTNPGGHGQLVARLDGGSDHDGTQTSPRRAADSISLPEDAQNLVEFYFENCVVTYRMFHRQSVEGWLNASINPVDPGISAVARIGNARTAILLTIMSIATLRLSKMTSGMGDAEWNADAPRRLGDHYFASGSSLTEREAEQPTLEMAQAWLVQVLYLLQTARMNKAWYRLGSAYQVVAALGLHRRSGRKRDEPARSSPAFINLQCGRRTFWVAYTIDAYLSIVLGRPRYFHDDDMSQTLPDALNDEDMGSSSLNELDEVAEYDCNMDAVIAHSRLAMIISDISRNVYTVKSTPKEFRLASAKKAGQELKSWYANLAPHLRSIRPSSLIPSLRRQAVALKLAYHHALMHAYRPFLSSNDAEVDAQGGIAEDCLTSSKIVLQTADAMAKDSAVFHAFWWSSYTVFCALTIVYVWEIQQRTGGYELTEENRKVFALAEKCHGLLAQSTSLDSPNRRYAVILEELRQEAQIQHSGATPATVTTAPTPTAVNTSVDIGLSPHSPMPMMAPTTSSVCDMSQSFQQWQPMNWLELDASRTRLISKLQAFVPYPDLNASIDAYLQPDLM